MRTAEQFDAELVENEKLLGLVEIADGGQAENAGIGERLLEVADRRVANDVRGVGFVGREGVDGGRFRGEVEFEFVGADADVVAFVENSFVGFLAVDVGAVAAAGVADDPAAIAIELHFSMDTRAEGIAERNFAILAATQARGGRAIEEEILAGAAADGHREIGEFWSGCDRHGCVADDGWR